MTERGTFRFYGVSGETEIRVTKAGYDTTVHHVIVTNHQTTEVEIVPSRPRASSPARAHSPSQRHPSVEQTCPKSHASGPTLP